MTFQQWLDQLPDQLNSEEVADEFWIASFKMAGAPARELRRSAAKFLDARDEFLEKLIQLRGKNKATNQTTNKGKP